MSNKITDIKHKKDALILQTSIEAGFWRDVVSSTTLEFSIEYAIEAADKAVRALRTRSKFFITHVDLEDE